MSLTTDALTRPVAATICKPFAPAAAHRSRDLVVTAPSSQPLAAPLLALLLGRTPPGWMVLAWDMTLVMGVFLGLASVVGFLAIWAERKVAGRIQHRHGPNRVGPIGLLQSLADGIKLATKEDLAPGRADRVLFNLAPYLAFAPVFVAFLALPFGPDLVFDRSLSVSLLWVLAILGVEVIGIILAGWSSNNKWSVYGAMREACQLVSYEIPLGLSMLVVVLAAGTLDLTRLTAMQADRLDHWLIFRQPFTAVGAVVFFVATLASNKRAPFDLPESDSELVAGYHTEYSGLRFSLFYLAEYCAMFVTSAILAVLFLGGWADPFGIIAAGYAKAAGPAPVLAWNLAAAGVFMSKAAALLFVQMWVRWTLPRPRIDQVLYICVKVMIPGTLVLLFGSALWELLVTPDSVVGRVTRTTLAAGGVAFLAATLGLVVAAFVQGRGDRSVYHGHVHHQDEQDADDHPGLRAEDVERVGHLHHGRVGRRRSSRRRSKPRAGASRGSRALLYLRRHDARRSARRRHRPPHRARRRAAADDASRRSGTVRAARGRVPGGRAIGRLRRRHARVADLRRHAHRRSRHAAADRQPRRGGRRHHRGRMLSDRDRDGGAVDTLRRSPAHAHARPRRSARHRTARRLPASLRGRQRLDAVGHDRRGLPRPASAQGARSRRHRVIGLTHYLVLAAVLFTSGVVTVLTRRHAIGILMGIELMLNAGNLNLVAFNRYAAGGRVDGQAFALFVIIIAAAEAAVALAIFLNFYNSFATVDVDRGSELRG